MTQIFVILLVPTSIVSVKILQISSCVPGLDCFLSFFFVPNKIHQTLTPWHEDYKPEDASIWSGSNQLYDDYFVAIEQLSRRKKMMDTPAAGSGLGIVFTAMHGVGHRWCLRAFEKVCDEDDFFFPFFFPSFFFYRSLFFIFFFFNSLYRYKK